MQKIIIDVIGMTVLGSVVLVATFLIVEYIFEKIKEKRQKKGLPFVVKVEANDTQIDKPVPCAGCKCLINKSDANVVLCVGVFATESFYCNKCKPPYTKIKYDVYSNTDNKCRYYKNSEFEVDINGKIIK